MHHDPVATAGFELILTITHYASHALIQQTLRYSLIVPLLNSIYTQTAQVIKAP